MGVIVNYVLELEDCIGHEPAEPACTVVRWDPKDHDVLWFREWESKEQVAELLRAQRRVDCTEVATWKRWSRVQVTRLLNRAAGDARRFYVVRPGESCRVHGGSCRLQHGPPRLAPIIRKGMRKKLRWAASDRVLASMMGVDSGSKWGKQLFDGIAETAGARFRSLKKVKKEVTNNLSEGLRQ